MECAVFRRFSFFPSVKGLNAKTNLKRRKRRTPYSSRVQLPLFQGSAALCLCGLSGTPFWCRVVPLWFFWFIIKEYVFGLLLPFKACCLRIPMETCIASRQRT